MSVKCTDPTSIPKWLLQCFISQSMAQQKRAGASMQPWRTPEVVWKEEQKFLPATINVQRNVFGHTKKPITETRWIKTALGVERRKRRPGWIIDNIAVWLVGHEIRADIATKWQKIPMDRCKCFSRIWQSKAMQFAYRARVAIYVGCDQNRPSYDVAMMYRHYTVSSQRHKSRGTRITFYEPYGLRMNEQWSTTTCLFHLLLRQKAAQIRKKQ